MAKITGKENKNFLIQAISIKNAKISIKYTCKSTKMTNLNKLTKRHAKLTRTLNADTNTNFTRQ